MALRPRAALLSLLALTCARAELYRSSDEMSKVFYNKRSIKSTEGVEDEVRGCLYGGRWFAEGAAVRAADACLRCRCAHAALSCARAACAPAPDPPPRRCALLHRRGACCPELHCPDGVRTLELEANGRLEDESWDVATPAARGHACMEEGALFAAGSALATRAACEQCFCLRGSRRCVRPRCLPPPAGCAPRPAAGACCPSRYYCEKPNRNITSTSAPPVSTTIAHRLHDCKVNGEWISEGMQVAATAAGAGNCSQCFCLRGAVRCQPQACAPALRGCQPLLRPGQCCPHQYSCPHHHTNDFLGPLAPILSAISDNSLISKRNDDRSFRLSASTKSAFVARTAPASTPTTQSASDPPPATTKVKRKTSDPPPSTSTTSHKTTPKEIKATSPKATSPKDHPPKVTSPKTTSPSTTVNLTQESTTTTTAKIVSSTETTTAAQTLEHTTTEQPENSVKIMINGTINCTAELSSKLTNTTVTNETDKSVKEVQARISENSNVEAQTTTLEPTDIITDRNYGAGFIDGDSFVINVTSSLNGNSSRPFAPPAPPPVLTAITHTANMTKKTKEDYDYDYQEPTLPPSLPNLKIIPFVAADAVLDDDAPAKGDPYSMMEREDKFPVYYPTLEQKEIPYATRREDVYNPTQYPVFVSEKRKDPVPRPSIEKTKKPVTSPPSTTTTRQQTVPTPEVNLFSPPAETEGGFVPKGPGIIDEYYAVYPSTPLPVPHLTTSMQINPDSPDKVECMTPDGRRVPEGESVWLACSVCACAWAELHCAPRRCPPPPPSCRRRPASASSADLCCGEIVCNDNTTTVAPNLPTRKTEITLNVTKVPIEPISDVIPFDPPADRSVPEPSNAAPANQDKELQEKSTHNNATNVTTPVVSLHMTPNTSTSMPISETKEKPTTVAPEMSSSTVISTISSKPSTTEPTTPERNETSHSDSQSQEYEDEDEDEGFSFGNVLKLLLSDSYDTTSASPKKKPTTATLTSSFPITTSPRPSPPTTKRLVSKPTGPSFIPVQPHAYIPPQKIPPQNTVNRIDHLVLGEATAIKKTTVRPTTHSFRPISTPIRRFSPQTTTRRPVVLQTTRATTKATTTQNEEPTEYVSPSVQTVKPVVSVGSGLGGGGGAGLLKLAGCNIYGRMYRVGRIISELSTPCQECRCTELGVQCQPLRC